MEGMPVKFRFLELYSEAENGEAWNYEIIDVMKNEYDDFKDDYGRNVLNYALIEMAASGFIRALDMKEDVEGIFRKGSILTLYRITNIGLEQLDDLKKGLKPR